MIASALWATAVGCGDDDPDTDGPSNFPLPTTYAFDSRFVESESSVVYTGQVGRHLLIEDMKSYIGEIDDQTFASAVDGEVVAALRYYTDFKNQGGTDDVEIGVQIDTAVGSALQNTYGEVGSLTSLVEKLPDADAAFDVPVLGWSDDTLTPTQVLNDMLEGLEDLVLARVNGTLPLDPDGDVIEKPYVSAEGLDYQQLLQKYLTGAVAYSQGADDYLDDDTPGKGLLSDNTAAIEGKPYTGLEHVWDEGFGYFGAARNFNDFTDDEIAKNGGRNDWQGAHDANGDGAIDFTSEFNFGHSTNAAKRDRGSKASIDLTKQAFDAFLAGRALIVSADGALNDTQLTQLRGYRDTALGAWEKAIAATVVHYINDTLADMATFGTDDYSFESHAKHWSELKGFALVLQFNRNHSTISRAQVGALQAAIGLAPVLANADASVINDYAAGLRTAREDLFTIYGFDAANLGDDNGAGGW